MTWQVDVNDLGEDYSEVIIGYAPANTRALVRILREHGGPEAVELADDIDRQLKGNPRARSPCACASGQPPGWAT